MRYERIPEAVEAVQWDGTPEGVRALKLPAGLRVEKLSRSRGLIVVSERPDWLCIPPGGWVLRSAEGRFWTETEYDFARKYRILDGAAATAPGLAATTG